MLSYCSPYTLKNTQETLCFKKQRTQVLFCTPLSEISPFLGGSHEQRSVPASLDNCEATPPSYIVSTGAGSGATHRTAHLFFHKRAKPVTKEKTGEDERWRRNQKQISSLSVPEKAVRQIHISRHLLLLCPARKVANPTSYLICF